MIGCVEWYIEWVGGGSEYEGLGGMLVWMNKREELREVWERGMWWK